MIYQEFFTTWTISPSHALSTITGSPIDFLLVNHTINEEASKILYSERKLEFNISWVNTPFAKPAEQTTALDNVEQEISESMAPIVRGLKKFKSLDSLTIRLRSMGEAVVMEKGVDLLRVIDVVKAMEGFQRVSENTVIRVFDQTSLGGEVSEGGKGGGDGMLLEEYVGRLSRFEMKVVTGSLRGRW